MTVKVFDDNGTCVSSTKAHDLSYDGAGKATAEALWRAYRGEYELSIMAGIADAAYEEVTEYTVSILPRDWDEVMPDSRYHWEIHVVYRGRDLWAVKQGVHCLSKSGTWDWEMRPSEREDEWLAEHRFDLTTALQLARKHAPDVNVNGHSAREVLAKYREEKRA